MDLIPLSDDELLYRSFYEELGEDGMKPRMPGDAGLKSALAKAVGEYCKRPDERLRAKIEQMCGGFTYGLYRRGL